MQTYLNKISISAELITTGVLIINSNGVVNESNSYCNEIFGRNIVGERWSTIYISEFDSFFMDSVNHNLKNGKVISMGIKSDNKMRVITLTDITNTVDLSGAISKKNRLLSLGEMAGTISHQLKTPLSIALLQAEMLEDTHSSRKIIKNIIRVDNILSNMLQFSKGSDNNIGLVSSIDITSWISKNYKDIDFYSNERKFLFIGNVDLIVSAFENMIRNSIQACNCKPSISLIISRNSNNCVFTYTDNCGGVEPGLDIFGRNISSKFDGNGIGMNIVKFIIEAHGGKINHEPLFNNGIKINISIPLEESVQNG